MLQHFKNEKGISMVGSLIMVTLLAYIGASVSDFTSSDTSSTTNELQTIQALQIGNGGLQEAKEKLTNGESPNVTSKSLGNGSYTTTTDPTTQLVTVTAQVGTAKKIQSLTTTFSQQALTMDVTPTYINNKDLKGIELIKSANNKAVLTQMKVEWNWNTCVQNLTCTPTTGTSNSSDPETGKTTICHYPPGNPTNKHTISVGQSAVAAHTAHGDTVGACPGDTGTSTVVCEGYDSQVAACGAASVGPLVKKIKVDGNFIANNVSALNGAIIDTDDITLTNNQAFLIDEITWDQNLPSNTWYAVTAYFADGSQVRKSFKFGASGTTSTSTSSTAYSVSSGTVTVNPNKTVKVDVLGSSITCGAGGSEIYVRVDLGIGNSWTQLFNNQDVDGGESYTTTTPSSNTTFKVRGRASRSSCNNFSSTYDSTNTVQVKTLVNGQQAPALAGFGGQKPVQAFLSSYLNSSGQVVLQSNQVIMLFELGVNGNSGSSAADFQDLVVLMTIN